MKKCKQKWKRNVQVLLEEFREMGVAQTKSPQTVGREWMFSGKIQFQLHVY